MKHQDLPDRWKQKIIDYLQSKGKGAYTRLGTSDFSSKAVKLQFEDGSFAEFKYAFFIEAPEFNELAVFTEHCGYHIFNAGALGVEIINH